MGYWDILSFVGIEKTLGNYFDWPINIENSILIMSNFNLSSSRT